MAYRILTKNGIDNTNIDGARDQYFNAGMRDGIVKGALNEGIFSTSSTNSVFLDACELRISGHRVVIDEPVYKTFENAPTTNTRYAYVAEIKVDDNSNVEFGLFVQSANIPLVKDNLFKTTKGKGTYQLEIGRFTLQTDGTITDIVRTADVITGGGSTKGAVQIGNVTTEKIDINLPAEVDIDQRFDEQAQKEYLDFKFHLPIDLGNIDERTQASYDNSAEAKRLAQEANDTSKTALSTADGAMNIADEANTKSDNAVQTSNDANTKAENAETIAGQANTKSEQAVETANNADKTATEAKSVAEQADLTADSALTVAGAAADTANAAEETANQANTTSQEAKKAADEAVSTATSANKTASDANDKSDAATLTANSAKDTAEGIDAKATEALTNSETAVNTANEANSTAGSANTKAETASKTAGDAKSIAEGANTKSDTAVSTAEEANTNSSNALSTAQTAETNSMKAIETATGASSKADDAVKTAETAETNSNTAISTADEAKQLAEQAVAGQGTKVTVGGVFQAEWNADTKVDKLDGIDSATYDPNTDTTTVIASGSSELSDAVIPNGAGFVAAIYNGDKVSTPPTEDELPEIVDAIIASKSFGKLKATTIIDDENKYANITYPTSQTQLFGRISAEGTVEKGIQTNLDVGQNSASISITDSDTATLRFDGTNKTLSMNGDNFITDSKLSSKLTSKADKTEIPRPLWLADSVILTDTGTSSDYTIEKKNISPLVATEYTIMASDKIMFQTDKALYLGIVTTVNDTTVSAKPKFDAGSVAEVNSKYTKPSGGIPKTDLASAVQTSLDKADAAFPKAGGAITGNTTVGGTFSSYDTLAALTRYGNAFELKFDGNTGLELGRKDGTKGSAYIDFHTNGNEKTDFNVRLLANGTQLQIKAASGITLNDGVIQYDASSQTFTI